MGAVTGIMRGIDVGNVRRNAEANQSKRIKTVLITTAATVDRLDTLTVTLANYGLSDVKAIRGVSFTTANGVIVMEPPTTTVTAGVLSILVGGTATNRVRSYLIMGTEA